MATIRIHEDQENQRREPLKAKKMQHAMMGISTNNGNNGGNQQQLQPQKRAVLGLIQSNRLDNNVQTFKGKPQASAVETVTTANVDKENWQQQNLKKTIVNPIIPVAKFEAFKVYEDEERLARIDAILTARSTSHVYKGANDDRFYTKTEVAEMERKGLIPKAKPHNRAPPTPPSPMSIEKDYENEFMDTVRHAQEGDDYFKMEEYSRDIYSYLREHEKNNRAKAGYMKKQPDVTASMRSILVDWLVEVAEEYKLHTETLYLTVNYVDRFLSYMSVVRAKLQLVGTAAMFLASKYEEIYPPDIGEFVYITDDTYTKRQIIRMEHLIVKVLHFDLSCPTPLSFINTICTINNLEDKQKFFAMYLCELSLLEGETYLEYLPSELACAALVIGRLHMVEPALVWPEDLQQGTGYNLGQLENCIKFLYRMFQAAPAYPQHAIQDKYKSQKYLNVSQMEPKYEQFPF